MRILSVLLAALVSQTCQAMIPLVTRRSRRLASSFMAPFVNRGSDGVASQPSSSVPVYRNAQRTGADRPRLNLHIRTPRRGFYPQAGLPEQGPTLSVAVKVASGRERRIVASSLTTVEELRFLVASYFHYLDFFDLEQVKIELSIKLKSFHIYIPIESEIIPDKSLAAILEDSGDSAATELHVAIHIENLPNLFQQRPVMLFMLEDSHLNLPVIERPPMTTPKP